MELLVTLRNKSLFTQVKDYCDGIIVGSIFSSGYNYSIIDLKEIYADCKVNNIKFYVVIDSFISEDDRVDLINYFDFLSDLDIDGIYFHDLGVIPIAKSFSLTNKLIYDGQTVLCNSLDVAYFMSREIQGVVLSRELTLEEINAIINNNPYACDLQVFGHTRLSYSKRKFLTNYFKEIDKEYDYFNKDTLYLIEEKRDYKLPIMEDDSGSKIYSDYVMQMYEEFPALSTLINRAIVDTLFIDDECIIQVLKDFRKINMDNAEPLLERLTIKFPNTYSTGFLYKKTNITKDEQQD